VLQENCEILMPYFFRVFRDFFFKYAMFWHFFTVNFYCPYLALILSSTQFCIDNVVQLFPAHKRICAKRQIDINAQVFLNSDRLISTLHIFKELIGLGPSPSLPVLIGSTLRGSRIHTACHRSI